MSATLRKTLHVLTIVDNDADFHALATALAADGRAHYEVERADFETAALELTPDPRHDVVLFAHANSATALGFLRAAVAKCAPRPVLFLPAELDAADEESALHAGAAECLALSALQPMELGRAIHRAVRHAGRRSLELDFLRVSDAEQQQLGAELHDELGQQLAGLAFMAGALCDRLKTSLPHEAPQAEALAKLAREATQQSRSLARGLHPVQFEEDGLAAALEQLAAQSQAAHGIPCRFQRRGSLPKREHSAELHLYRITQEAIRNAVRHGAARRIGIMLASRARTHRLTVWDDGAGFDPAQARASVGGHGLRLMEYRATMLGGEFSVSSQPGRGARIACLFASSSL